MAGRIPDSAMRDNVMFNLARSQARVAELNNQVSTGKRLNSPGDDAVAWAKAKDLRQVFAATEQFQANIGRADDRLSVTESTLSSMQGVLNRAGELALQMANGTVNESQRSSMATEVQHLIDEMVNLGNTRLNGSYIFAGYASGSPAFDATGTYLGDSGAVNIPVGEGLTVRANVPGNEVLAPVGGVDVFTQLIALRDGLATNDVAAISATIDPLVESNDQLSQSRMVTGLQLSKLETRKTTLEEVMFQTQRLLSEQEDVDLASAISELVVQQNTLEVSRNVLGRILGNGTLMDYLR